MRGLAFEVAPFAFRDSRDRGEQCEFETLQLEAPPGMPTLRLGSRGAAVAELQRRLAALGLGAGAADGIFGSRTDAAVRSFQRARGLTADGIVGMQTWGQLLGPTTPPWPSPSPPPATGSPGQVLVTVPSGVRISDNAVRVLKDILRTAGLTRATVTSGRRTPYDQARIMYELIERHGVSYAKELYGRSGDQVIDVYAAAKAAGKGATDIKGAMEVKVNQLGCHNVSHHCSDSFDVFDVAPSTISNSTAFRRALDAAVASGAIKMYLSPPEDPAFHIEIALAPGVGELEAFGEFEDEFEDEFRPASLPKPVREAMDMGALAWPLAVQRAIASGLRKLDELTNIVFFMHHPERMFAGIGSALDPGEPRFAALSAEWKGFRTLVAPMLKPPAAPAQPSPSTLDLLRRTSFDRSGTAASLRSRLDCLRRFLADALSGSRVDDRYWTFQVFDGFGRRRDCSFDGTIGGLLRDTTPRHAVADFNRLCAGARTTDAMSACVARLHHNVLCPVNAMLGWARHQSAVGDAPIRDFTECAWALELLAASRRAAPRSVYACFGALLAPLEGVCT